MGTLTRLAQTRSALYRVFGRQLCAGARADVEITPRCVERIKELKRMRGTDVALRVTVDGGGCSGFQYGFEIENWDHTPRHKDLTSEGDNLFEKDGAYVIIDDMSLAYMSGSKVDYIEEMISSSFRITDNPNSEASCGCGVSFSPKM